MANATVPIRWPPGVDDRMRLSQVFEGRFTDLFRKLQVHTVADLKACRELGPTEIMRINAWLSRCWWFD